MTTLELSAAPMEYLKKLGKDEQQHKICTFSAVWMPLHFLYLDSVRSGELEPINKIPRERKLKWWALIKKTAVTKTSQFSVATALYMWEQITAE